MRFSFFTLGALVMSTSAVCVASCTTDGPAIGAGADGGPDGQSLVDGSGPGDHAVDANYIDVTPPPADEYCGLPGSLLFEDGGRARVPGGSTDDISFLTLPDGYCAHAFATVPSARAIRFAPGGELFVASPSQPTSGGAPTGKGAIIVLPDDDGDGLADSANPFQANAVATQGIMFTSDSFYFQDGTKVMKVPYAKGQRTNTATPTQMIDVQVYVDSGHWPKTMDVADDGTIYVTNGGNQLDACTTMPPPFRGGILQIDGTSDGKEVAEGFRNPMYMRCQRGHNNCFVSELTRDFSNQNGGGGREKLVHIVQGQDWGFPCCASQNLPFPEYPTSDCSGVQPDSDSFRVGDTPFGLDFEPNAWSGTWNQNIFVALHGAVSTWYGARVIAVQTDTSTGMPLPGTTVDGGNPSGAMRTFASGWDDDTRMHGRPADVTFSTDGRLFIANDWNGQIFWVAPIGLKIKK